MTACLRLSLLTGAAGIAVAQPPGACKAAALPVQPLLHPGRDQRDRYVQIRQQGGQLQQHRPLVQLALCTFMQDRRRNHNPCALCTSGPGARQLEVSGHVRMFSTQTNCEMNHAWVPTPR